MQGQSNKKLRTARIPQKLRRSMTRAERVLWGFLRDGQLHGWQFRRQHLFGNYILDFVCIEARLVIEVDGGQHAEQSEADAMRTIFLNEAGFQVIRFWNNQVLGETEAVLDRVLLALNERKVDGRGTPSPPCPSP
jgi:very-short-patch-repair endonuclease